MMDLLSKEVKPILMNDVVVMDGNRNDAALLAKLRLATTTTANTLTTRSSPTLTDSSEEFDSSMEDVDNVDDPDNETTTTITQQPSGIDTSEVADNTLSTPQQQRPFASTVTTAATIPNPKRSNLIHSMEESRRSRSFRRQEQMRTTAGYDRSLSSHDTTINDTNNNNINNDDDILLQEQPQPESAAASVDTTAPPKFVVQFSNVTIRDYPRSMGDNPASTSGPSVSIGWEPESEVTIPLDDFEENRGPRRLGREMLLPAKIREELLRQEGYSRAEIAQGIRDINIIRGQRRRTYETLHLQSFQLLTERISRKAWNVLTLGEYKRKERSTLQELTQRSSEAWKTGLVATNKKTSTTGSTTNSTSSTVTTVTSYNCDEDESSSSAE